MPRHAKESSLSRSSHCSGRNSSVRGGWAGVWGAMTYWMETGGGGRWDVQSSAVGNDKCCFSSDLSCFSQFLAYLQFVGEPAAGGVRMQIIRFQPAGRGWV